MSDKVLADSLCESHMALYMHVAQNRKKGTDPLMTPFLQNIIHLIAEMHTECIQRHGLCNMHICMQFVYRNSHVGINWDPQLSSTLL